MIVTIFVTRRVTDFVTRGKRPCEQGDRGWVRGDRRSCSAGCQDHMSMVAVCTEISTIVVRRITHVNLAQASSPFADTSLMSIPTTKAYITWIKSLKLGDVIVVSSLIDPDTVYEHTTVVKVTDDSIFAQDGEMISEYIRRGEGAGRWRDPESDEGSESTYLLACEGEAALGALAHRAAVAMCAHTGTAETPVKRQLARMLASEWPDDVARAKRLIADAPVFCDDLATLRRKMNGSDLR